MDKVNYLMDIIIAKYHNRSIPEMADALGTSTQNIWHMLNRKRALNAWHVYVLWRLYGEPSGKANYIEDRIFFKALDQNFKSRDLQWVDPLRYR